MKTNGTVESNPAPPVAKRYPLPSRRSGETQKFMIGGQTCYMRTGLYPDGTLGEIWIDCAKEGAAFRSMSAAMAIAVSIGLQHGVPLEEYVEAMVYTRFAPDGVVTGHPRLTSGLSFLDVIFRDLGINFLGRDELAHVQISVSPAPDEIEEPGQAADQHQPATPDEKLSVPEKRVGFISPPPPGGE